MNKYKIIKYGKFWYIIEPTRHLLLRSEEVNDLLKFCSKEQALTYCKENNLEVSRELEEIIRQELNEVKFMRKEINDV